MCLEYGCMYIWAEVYKKGGDKHGVRLNMKEDKASDLEMKWKWKCAS